MEILYAILAVCVFAGVALAIYEHRKKDMLLKHDFNLEGHEQTEAHRESERSADVFTNNAHR